MAMTDRSAAALRNRTLFELKYDGFRALAVIQPGRAQLVPAMAIHSRHLLI
jgi:hypothetical protein